MTKLRGLFITIEGPDGAGKSTQVKLLGAYYQQRGYQVVFTREPGGTEISEQIRRVLLNPDNHAMTVNTEILLYAAARAQHVDQVVNPGLEQGHVVICDRFVDSTMAYQGYGRNIDLQVIHHLNALATRGLEPDLTIILDLPVEVGLARVKARSIEGQPDRLEQELTEFHQRVRTGFLKIAEQHAERCRVIDATTSAEVVQSAIRQVIQDKWQQ